MMPEIQARSQMYPGPAWEMSSHVYMAQSKITAGGFCGGPIPGKAKTRQIPDAADWCGGIETLVAVDLPSCL